MHVKIWFTLPLKRETKKCCFFLVVFRTTYQREYLRNETGVRKMENLLTVKGLLHFFKIW